MPNDSNQTTCDLTDGEITEMARKSRFVRELDERDARRRQTRRNPPRSLPTADAGTDVPKPKRPAGGAAAMPERNQ